VDEIQRELLEIVTQVRGHLEYRKALGMSVVEVATCIPESVPEQIIAPVVAQHLKEKASSSNQPAMVPSLSLETVREELGECERCKLCKNRKTIVFGEGDAHARLVFIGEGPGQEEDEQGRPFVGPAGQLLTDIIVKGLKLKREEVYICNIVKCRPPDNRNPEPDEIAACEPFLRKQIQAINPRFIIGLGNVAVKTLLNTKQGITSLRGKWQQYQGIPLMPTFHPAYLLRTPADKKLVWEDIQKVIAAMKKP